MKKSGVFWVFLVFINFSALCDTGEQEIDHLLFMPDSGTRFVNPERAMNRLDNLAEYLKTRDIIPGQIHVYGYSANFSNEVDPGNISRDRALLVINELISRGVAGNLFSDPVGYGAVDLWGNNTEEEGRSPNRRVRVVLDGYVLPPVLPAAQPEPELQSGEIAGEPAGVEKTGKSKFPWQVLLLLLILFALLFLLLKHRKKEKRPEPVKETPVEILDAPAVPVPVITSEKIVNLDEEIRYCAYMFHLGRNGQNENPVEDWLRAVPVICGKYTAGGYKTYMENQSWRAKSKNN